MSPVQIVLILLSSLIGLFLLGWLVGWLLGGASRRYPDRPRGATEAYPGELNDLRDLEAALIVLANQDDRINQLLRNHTTHRRNRNA